MKHFYDERAALVRAMEELRTAAAKIDAELATCEPELVESQRRARDAFNFSADFLMGRARFYPETEGDAP